MLKLKNILAGLCLFAFLFPQMESVLHTYAHMDDFHCTDNSTFHFHKADHHCTLCDLTNELTETPSLPHFALASQVPGDINLFFLENNYLLQPKVFQSLRAPPTLA